ncbi:hypothetical protein B0H16DRAFT_1464108 [Mycena metata]|uniref:Uncharacterized protein n=1 Tax=Mycena metata TaxID=1033252 RepID=A0AAD7N1Z4_9AGAR|nr:hypothetical protein B0H16DRAFT_1464108 [Mycena metata]
MQPTNHMGTSRLAPPAILSPLHCYTLQTVTLLEGKSDLPRASRARCSSNHSKHRTEILPTPAGPSTSHISPSSPRRAFRAVYTPLCLSPLILLSEPEAEADPALLTNPSRSPRSAPTHHAPASVRRSAFGRASGNAGALLPPPPLQSSLLPCYELLEVLLLEEEEADDPALYRALSGEECGSVRARPWALNAFAFEFTVFCAESTAGACRKNAERVGGAVRAYPCPSLLLLATTANCAVGEGSDVALWGKIGAVEVEVDACRVGRGGLRNGFDREHQRGQDLSVSRRGAGGASGVVGTREYFGFGGSPAKNAPPLRVGAGQGQGISGGSAMNGHKGAQVWGNLNHVES